MKHRALIIGAGRIGAGFNFVTPPYIYNHADTYLALRERVELVGFVEPDEERAGAAERKYKLPVYNKLSRTLLEHLGVDIISVCTQPDLQPDTLLTAAAIIKGAWVEKPYVCRSEWPFKTNVNYIRRFDLAHIGLEGIGRGTLEVWAKRDIHTVCHFTDLARFWGLPKESLIYHEVAGPNRYEWSMGDIRIKFEGGGIVGGFMETALHNLLDAVEGRDSLISPPESAVVSEEWANEILKG